MIVRCSWYSLIAAYSRDIRKREKESDAAAVRALVRILQDNADHNPGWYEEFRTALYKNGKNATGQSIICVLLKS